MKDLIAVRLRIDRELAVRARMRGALAAVIKEALSCYVLAAPAVGAPLPTAHPQRVDLEAPVHNVLWALELDEGRPMDHIVNDALQHWLDAGVLS